MKQLDVRSAAHIAATLDDVRIRPYGRTDRDRVRRMSDRLSSASLYTRFFSGTPRIPEHYVRLLDTLDHWDREALVALADGEIAGIAEYARNAAQPGRADLAVLVTDPWQRRGWAAPSSPTCPGSPSGAASASSTRTSSSPTGTRCCSSEAAGPASARPGTAEPRISGCRSPSPHDRAGRPATAPG